MPTSQTPSDRNEPESLSDWFLESGTPEDPLAKKIERMKEFYETHHYHDKGGAKATTQED